MRVWHWINSLISEINPRYVLSFLAMGLLATVFIWLITVKRPKWDRFGYLVLLIVLIRCLLFGNPWAWDFYRASLSVDDLGWRQQSVVYVEYYKFFKYPGKKYLAVGSSQTYTLYQEYSQRHPGLTVFNLAGMTPIDFYLYRQYIADRNPQYILLYLTEFDLAKEPSLLAAKIAPSLGWDLFRHWPVLYEISKEAKTELALKEIALGELMPEYKYSFIFKGLLQKFSKRNQALSIDSLYKETQPNVEQLARGIQGVQRELDEKWISYQAYFLREFLEFCQRRSTKVIVIEGQYNPLVVNEKTQRLHFLTQQALLSLLKEYPLIKYVPKSETLPLTDNDFSDAVHFKKESALRFAQDLLDKLDRGLPQSQDGK
ncbi:MAG: hypothetical protein JNN05_11620 [Candidatus Omnitrophica bacterium]|nr:hypothetical protein [Candidatus Omnitrophota bacterium]